jgi:gentisate 1,2-dioxygenase
MATHPLGARPGRGYNSVAFNYLAGNSVLTAFLAGIEPGGTKCGHRHFDETLSYVVAGRGSSEFRQLDDRPLTRVNWSQGDLLAIPTNAWHHHFNGPDEGRLLSFKNAPAIKRLIGFADDDNHADLRLRDRYDDEADFFTRAEVRPDGSIRTNFLGQVASSPLSAPDPTLGEGVSRQRYVMGGHRTLSVDVVSIQPGGTFDTYRPLAEEGILILKGNGLTRLFSADGAQSEVEWSAGDLVSPPFYVSRQHENLGNEEIRLLCVRNTFVEVGLGFSVGQFDRDLPDRFPEVADVGA